MKEHDELKIFAEEQRDKSLEFYDKTKLLNFTGEVVAFELVIEKIEMIKAKTEKKDWKNKLIDAWKPLFEMYPTLQKLPVYCWGRYYKSECAGRPFECFVDEGGFPQFDCRGVEFDIDLLKEIENKHNVPDGKIWQGEIGEYSPNRSQVVEEYNFDERFGKCLVIEKDENGEFELKIYDCDSPE